MRTKRINIRKLSRGCWLWCKSHSATRPRERRHTSLSKNGVMHFWRMNKYACVSTRVHRHTDTKSHFPSSLLNRLKIASLYFAAPVPSLRSAPSCHFASAASMCLQQCARHTSAAVFSLLFSEFNANERQRERERGKTMPKNEPKRKMDEKRRQRSKQKMEYFNEK